MFSYFGGKSKIARFYPAPAYPLVIEPFAGAAGYSMLHHRRAVILNDLDPSIVAVWRWLQRIKPSDLDRLPIVGSAEKLPFVQPEEARRFLTLALIQGKGEAGRNNAGWGPATWAAAKSKLALIRHFDVLCGDYSDLPDVEATWFVDPPYRDQTTRHYIEHKPDYAKLANWCRSRRGQVIVCEQAGADWLPFLPMPLPRLGQKGELREVVWTQ